MRFLATRRTGRAGGTALSAFMLAVMVAPASAGATHRGQSRRREQRPELPARVLELTEHR